MFLKQNNDKNNQDVQKIKDLNKKFKNIVLRNKLLYKKEKYYNVEKLINEKNGEKFYKKVRNMKSDNKSNHIDMELKTLVEHYEGIFNKNLNISNENYEKVVSEISDLILENFVPISISYDEIISVLKNTSASNVCGLDGLSANMIINCDENFLKKYILEFFNLIFNNCMFPKSFNFVYILSIIKNHNLPNNLVNNLRPISISNTFAQMFERLLILKMPEILNTHPNQFGFKKKTSCSHALFAFKETVIKYLDKGKIVYAISLDISKAFDTAWREGIFYKLKKRNINKNLLILLKIYYNGLAGKVKLNGEFSDLIYLKHGVKEGGCASPFLYNILMDDLIRLCYESGLGSKMCHLILCIFGFCDDVCLLSPTADDMQKLINICENYSKKWGMEFNVSKCKFIIFGHKGVDDSTFILNDSSIPYTDSLSYLGVDFKYNMDMASYFIEKFSKVRSSFFDLNSLGFYTGGINPFYQIKIYKSFCLSKFLYGLEIFTLTESTLKEINLSQNSIIRYIVGLAKICHMTDLLKVLELFDVRELNVYMKLVFIKNLKNNNLCKEIFNLLITNIDSIIYITV